MQHDGLKEKIKQTKTDRHTGWPKKVKLYNLFHILTNAAHLGLSISIFSLLVLQELKFQAVPLPFEDGL